MTMEFAPNSTRHGRCVSASVAPPRVGPGVLSLQVLDFPSRSFTVLAQAERSGIPCGSSDFTGRVRERHEVPEPRARPRGSTLRSDGLRVCLRR